jgi:RNA polymerase sigma-70 factor, ECF subfamily
VRSRDTAEELVQGVFLRIWQRHEQWEPAAGIRAYLFGACRNAALDHLKHLRIADRLTDAGEPDPTFAREVPAPDAAIQAEELADAVRRAIETLPERQRAVVVLRWQHELTNAEVARTLGISVKGVEAHVSRALSVLRQRLATLRRE